MMNARGRNTPDHALDYVTLIGRYSGAEDEQTRQRWGKAMNRHLLERGRALLAGSMPMPMPVM